MYLSTLSNRFQPKQLSGYHIHIPSLICPFRKPAHDMKTPILFLLSFISLLLLSGCRSSDPGATDSLECVSGVIVGDKCGVFALKLDKRHTLPGKTWPKPVDKEGRRVFAGYRQCNRPFKFARESSERRDQGVCEAAQSD